MCAVGLRRRGISSGEFGHLMTPRSTLSLVQTILSRAIATGFTNSDLDPGPQGV